MNKALWAVACVAALAGCGRVGGVGGPSAAREGDSWTHKELLAHLKAKGLEFREGRSGTGDREERPFVYIFWDGGKVRINLEESPQIARDKAGVEPEISIAWGRFFMTGTKESLAKVRPLLP